MRVIGCFLQVRRPVGSHAFRLSVGLSPRESRISQSQEGHAWRLRQRPFFSKAQATCLKDSLSPQGGRSIRRAHGVVRLRPALP